MKKSSHASNASFEDNHRLKRIGFAITIVGGFALVGGLLLVGSKEPQFEFLRGSRLKSYLYDCGSTGCNTTRCFISEIPHKQMLDLVANELGFGDGWMISVADTSRVSNVNRNIVIKIREGLPTRRFADGTYIAPTVIYVKQSATLHDRLFHSLLEEKYPPY